MGGVIKRTESMKPYTTPNNIWSGSSDGLLAALTNPTELAKRKGKLKQSYPVIDKTGKTWADSEAAYKFYKTGDTQKDAAIMTRIIKCKLEQHPRLAQTIAVRGGEQYLIGCNHIVGVKNSRWEGVGEESLFIKCLIAAYRLI
jgi:hypothetical protein